MGLSNELSCEAGSFSCCCLNPMGVFTQRFEALFPRAGALGCVVCFAPRHCSSWLIYARIWGNTTGQGLPATTLWGLLVAAWLAPFHNPPLHWVRQPLPCCESSLPQLPISAPPTGLDECFFFYLLGCQTSIQFDFLSVLVVFCF